MKAQIKAILFDKDGTLLDYHLSWGPINARAADFASRGDPTFAARLLVAGGFDAATRRIRAGSLLAAGSTTEIAQAWIDQGSTYSLEALTRGVDAVFREGVATVVPVLDLAAFFKRLKARGLTLGIASSDSEAAIRLTVERFGFQTDVDFITGYDSGHGTKPGAGMLDAFAAFARLPSRQIAVVGDNLHDMEMAQAGRAGMKVSVLTGTGDRMALTAASDICLESIAELEHALFG
jgi:phosphoglycolate phosphatase